MPSKPLQIALALRAIAEAALPGADIKGFEKAVSAEVRAGAGGTVIGRPPETVPEAEYTLSPLTYHYDYPFSIEMLAPTGAGGDAAAQLDGMITGFGADIIQDRTLGGLAEWVEVTIAEVSDETPTGSGTQRFAVFTVTVSFSTTNPLS